VEAIVEDGDPRCSQWIDARSAGAAREFLLIGNRRRRGERTAGADPINHPA
jgi:hypothetical protein